LSAHVATINYTSAPPSVGTHLELVNDYDGHMDINESQVLQNQLYQLRQDVTELDNCNPSGLHKIMKKRHLLSRGGKYNKETQR